MKTVAIIPARMESTRFPGKPLVPLLGIPMVEHVRRRLLYCSALQEVVVATCNREILETVEATGGRAVMTASSHVRCTDRVAEAIGGIEADVVVNVQGDEPLICPEMIDALLRPFQENPETLCTNLMLPITDETEFHNHNAVKAVVDLEGNALFLSREPIPTAKMGIKAARFKQLGIYAFTRNFLIRYTHLTPTPLEIAESVDMLRIVEHGFKLKMVAVEGFPMAAVDVPGDVEIVEAALLKDDLFRRYAL